MAASIINRTKEALPPPLRRRPGALSGWALLLLVLSGGGCLLLQRMEMVKGGGADTAAQQGERNSLPSGKRLRSLSVGFHGLLADWYWIRTLHYVGIEWAQAETTLPPLPLLEPLLELTLSLDPHRLSAYRMGAFLQGVTDQAWAERMVRQGIEANPKAWPLYQDLAYLCWRQGRYREAAQAYQSAARLPGAPAWLEPLAAVMLARGGDRDIARQLLERSCEASRDRFVREACQYQLSLLREADSAAPSPSKGARRGID